MKIMTIMGQVLPNKSIKITLITFLLSINLGACGGSSSDESKQPISKEQTPPVAEVVSCLGTTIDTKTSCIALNNRKAIVYKEDQETKDGIALFLHGAPGVASKVMRIFDANMIAREHNLIAISPEGINKNWGWNSTNSLNTNDNNDLNYITALLTKIRSEHNISSEKLYVFGYSAGGFMAYKLGCLMPEKITAIVSLAGQFRGDFEACTHTTPLTIHHLHSPTDKAVPYQGRPLGNITSVDDTIEHWRIKNGCDMQFSSKEQDPVTASSNKTITSTYKNCLASVALSKMVLASHDESYISNHLYQVYQYIFNN